MSIESIMLEIRKEFSNSHVLDVVFENSDIEDEVSDLFIDIKWEDVDLTKISFRDDVVIAMTNEAFIYFLPAFLMRLIYFYSDTDVLEQTVLQKLMPILSGTEYRKTWLDLMPNKLTEAQKNILAKVLFYLATEFDDSMCENLLDEYWFKYLEEA